METKIAKWGNSFAVRLPREVALRLLQIGGKVSIRSEQKKIVIGAIAEKRETLRTLVDRMSEDNIHELFILRDKPRGKEVW